MSDHPIDATPQAIDWAAFSRSVGAAARSLRESAEAAARVTRTMANTLRTLANDPVRVAGIEGKWTVRGGLDQAYRFEDNARAAAVMLATGRHPDTSLLTPMNRARVAAAFMTGWVTIHHPAEQRAIATETTPLFDAVGTRPIQVEVRGTVTTRCRHCHRTWADLDQEVRR